MNTPSPHCTHFILGFLCLALAACSTTKNVPDGLDKFAPSPIDPSNIVNEIPDYSNTLTSLKGKGRAIVSEPGNTERVTLLFASTRQKSMVTVRNGIGIEGGQLLTDGDTLLVYNKVDKFARKIPIRGGKLNRINRLASLNILDMISYHLSTEQVESLYESENRYLLELSSGTRIQVDRQSGLIRQIVQPSNSPLPYSRITYDAYASVEGFTLPRRITIFGADKKSKLALQFTALELNPQLDTLGINLPDDIPIYYQ
ncbi:MAG: DUF4292 domain-containing protein [Fodinibius sp.]|nr:DUF4292 domain-containing protein [Fodinibius sp.]